MGGLEGRSPPCSTRSTGSCRCFGIPPKGALAHPRLVSLRETKSLRDRNIPKIWNVAPLGGIITSSADWARKIPQDFQQSAPVPSQHHAFRTHDVALLLYHQAAGGAVHRDGDCGQHEHAEHHVLPVGVHADEVHAVIDDGHGEHAQDRAQRAALAASQ